MAAICPICKNNELKILFKQLSVPIFQNVAYNTEDEAKKAPVGDVLLTQCMYCGLVFNQTFDERLMRYQENYNNEQSSSLVFQKHCDAVLSKLMKYGLLSKKVVEIGCGKGYFLELLQKKNVNCLGFDPAYEGQNPRVKKEYFSNKYSDINADLLILRHVLEHIKDPLTFIHEIAKSNNYKGKIYIEVPNFEWILRKNSFWDIFYEHCNYFTKKTLSMLFEKSSSGFLFGKQYIYLIGDLSTLKNKIEVNKLVEYYEEFHIIEKINEFKNFLSNNESIVIWGAGAKGSTFLNILDRNRQHVRFVIDICVSKQNKYVAGTGHKILGPDSIKNQSIKTILVMNENYLQEIKKQVNDPSIKITSI